MFGSPDHLRKLFAAIGRPVLAMLSALLRQLIIFIPAALILSPRMGVEGVLWSGPISDTVSAVLTLLMILATMRMMNKKEKEVCKSNLTSIFWKAGTKPA